MKNDPVNVLSAWIALEVLSGQSFRREEEFNVGTRRVIRFESTDAPWHEGPNGTESNYFYQVVLGTIDMKKAFAKLIDVFEDERPERPPASGKAILASVTLDKTGIPVSAQVPSVAVSSFAWGLPIALQENLQHLGMWKDVKKTLEEELEKRLLKVDDDGGPQTLEISDVEQAYTWLIERLGLDPEMTRGPAFCIRSESKRREDKEPSPPAPLLIDSFFLKDLTTARESVREEQRRVRPDA